MEIAPLLAMRGFPLSRSGGEMHWRIPGEESVSIRGNMWYSHYRGKGGDAISFVRHFFHMDFKEAVRFLLEQSAAPAAGPVQCERQEQKQLRLPSKDSSEEQVRRYLTGIRKVSADVAGYFIETGQVYQSRAEGVRQGQEQCNLVLVGMDRDGAPRQAHIKGMRQRAFRYDAPGSDKAYGFRHMGGSGPLYVFEAAVDLMSYVSLYPKDWRQGNYLALNGTAEAALFRTLEEYPEVRGVVLALDNDAGGIEGVMRLAGLLREKGYADVSVQLPAWPVHPYGPRGGLCGTCMPTAGGLPQRVLRMAGPQTLFAPAEGSGTETPAAEPASALSRPWAGQPVSPDPPAAFLLAQAHPPPDERDEHLLHTQACLQSHDQLKTRAPHRAQSPCAPLLL